MGHNGRFTFRVDFPEGIFWITVRPGREGDPGQPYVGLLEVATTNPERDEKGYVTLRGRKYSIEFQVRKCVQPFRNARTGEMARWVIEHVPHHGGNRNEAGHQLDPTGPVDAKLDALWAQALNVFEAEFPDWQRLSQHAEIQSDLARADGEVDRLARELREAEAAAAALRSRLSSFRL